MGLIYFLGCWLVPVITDFSYWLLLKYVSAPDPLRGVEGRMAMSPPRDVPLFFLHCDFGQNDGHAVYSSQLYSAKFEV